MIVLGGPETEVEVTAARAVEVATALNQLVEEAAAKPPVFEVRAQPETSVAVQGRDAPVVTVTAEDAAAYELPFEPGMKGRRPSVRGLAAYWAVLLQDYFALFVQKQRPVTVLGVSSRGRVLGEDELGRPADTGGHGRAPFGGPAPFVLHGPRPARDGAPPPGREGIASHRGHRGSLGRAPWRKAARGRRASRPNSIQKDGGLGGKVTAQSGKITLDTPMRAVTFKRNEVRFTVDLQGSARTFTGTVQGGNLSGTIAKGADKAAGRFTLTYVE